MPFLQLQLAVAPGIAADDDTLALTLTRLAGELLGKRTEVTAVRIERVPSDAWFVGAEPIGSRLQSTAHLQIQITRGTNTPEQKARFIASAFDELGTLLGGLHPASYVVVDEIDADAWGYGGRTQASRRRVAA